MLRSKMFISLHVKNASHSIYLMDLSKEFNYLSSSDQTHFQYLKSHSLPFIVDRETFPVLKTPIGYKALAEN